MVEKRTDGYVLTKIHIHTTKQVSTHTHIHTYREKKNEC